MTDTSRLSDMLDRFSSAFVLVVGDVMLDVWTHGEASRTTEESGRQVPIFLAGDSTPIPGGAANAAMNISALGAWTVRLIGLVGADAAAGDLRSALPFDTDFVVDATIPTTTKTRYVSRHGHVARVDRESTRPAAGGQEDRILGLVAMRIQTARAVLLSDYAKGVLTPNVCQGVILLAREYGIPVVVDPKGPDWSKYKGATIITPNLDELTVTGLVESQMFEYGCAVLLKRGHEGMTLYDDGLRHFFGGDWVDIKAHPVLRPDAVGAGDTVAAAVTMALACKATPYEAAVLANAAAAVVCGKPGTATATRDEVRAMLGIAKPEPEPVPVGAGGWA